MMINIQISSVGNARDGSDAAAAQRRVTGSGKASRRGFGRDLAALYTGEGRCVLLEKPRS
ncbi:MULTISPECIES: hypothetical protein [Paraburkholderia]|uniref:hypothetical protein n=1 Tax=Paraburkholderia TaxID=1822464 RepID=UPI001553B62B|nr:hypothetical protein [Paraburkholderia phenazinium]